MTFFGQRKKKGPEKSHLSPPGVDKSTAIRRVWSPRFDWRARQGGAAGVTAVLTWTQWLSWGSTYYLMTVLAKPIVQETGWSLTFVIGGLSLGLVIAGLVSPSIGRSIEVRGGRPVLSFGSVTLAVGLVGLGLARNPLTYAAAWAVLGVGMSASLNDAAFAVLGRLYGLKAKPMISKLMLIIGFAVALSWPFTALLVEMLGWRGACFCYAGMHLGLGLPIHLFLLPTDVEGAAATAPDPRAAARAVLPDANLPRTNDRRTLLFWLVAANIMLQIVVGSVLAVHLLAMLQGIGIAYAVAVGLGSVIWVSQGGGRLIEAVIGWRFHPISEGIAASFFVLVGLALLLAGQPMMIAIGLVLFGLGNGVRGILKGTLPLVLFGADGYATLIGRLGLPTLIAQAAGPALGAVAIATWGPLPSLAGLVALAAINLVLAYALRIGFQRAAG